MCFLLFQYHGFLQYKTAEGCCVGLSFIDAILTDMSKVFPYLGKMLLMGAGKEIN